MRSVVLQPAASPATQKRYLDTVTHPVQLVDCVGLTTVNRNALQAAFTNGLARFWGATPAKNGANVTKYAKMRHGDIVLFVKKNRVFSRARVQHLFRSPELAKQLWGRQEDGQTWELMFAIDDVMREDIPVLELNNVIGYQLNKAVVGFTPLDAPKSARVLDYLGEGRG